MYKIYLFDKPEQISETFVQRALPCLPEERQQKALRYRRPADRKNCVISYLMLKAALKECFHITDFTMQYGAYGKPYLAGYSDIYFNISHCRCGCAVAVADEPVGIDMEEIRPFSWDIAKYVCHENEIKRLEVSENRERLFAKIWTMKESFFKMTGEGISDRLKEVDIFEERDFLGIEVENYVIACAVEK